MSSGKDFSEVYNEYYLKVFRYVRGKITSYHEAEDAIQSSGYIAKTLEAALWCLLTTTSFKECVLKAVNLGGDTDTVAAVAGSLAGYVYGRGGDAGIPEEWIRQLSRYEWLEERVEVFEQVLKK